MFLKIKSILVYINSKEILMKEKGSILVLNLFIITIILILLGSLAMVISNEIKIINYNLNRIQAIYKAETAIEEALWLINNNFEINETDLEAISGGLIYENDYYILEAIITFKSETTIYTLTAVGETDIVTRQIKVNIRKGDN